MLTSEKYQDGNANFVFVRILSFFLRITTCPFLWHQLQTNMGFCWVFLASRTANCCFISADLDTNKLLKKDLVTLDEAVKTANNAVVMAVTAVSVLKSVSLLLYNLSDFSRSWYHHSTWVLLITLRICTEDLLVHHVMMWRILKSQKFFM